MPYSTVTHHDAGPILLEAYEALLARSSRMLDAVRAADWDALIRQESEYVVQVDKLRHMDAELSLDSEALEHKAELLERILEQDLEIRRSLLARRDELGQLIGSSRQKLALSRTYGPQQGGPQQGGPQQGGPQQGSSPGAPMIIDAEQRFAKTPS
ncbi:MAG TPA: flagellar protein FliT [Halomonas sp.]|nr:flagellar protein FliT [Halomonas sp.]